MPFMNDFKKTVRLLLCMIGTLSLCVSMSSCLSKKYSVSTLSGTFEEFGIFYYRVSLNPDGTFEWHYIYDIADMSSDGNWWIEGNYLVLNSFIQNVECFPVEVYRADGLPQKDDVVILCDKVAYQNCLMCFSTARGSIAIDSDTISLCQSSFPDTINICIKANAISRVLSKSDDIIIKEPGIYRIETKGIFLQKRPVNYIGLDRRKFKILSKDSIQDVFSTNATLKRNTSDRNLDGTRNLTVTEKEEECSNGLIEPKG